MGKKIFFASDFHLGTNARLSSLEREKEIVRWLTSIKDEAEELYLVGDIFDFWFEYKRVVPKGFSRLFAKLVEFRDAGIAIHFFTGNHDMWMKDYFQTEFDIPVYHEPIQKILQGKRLFIGHGDGKGPDDLGYKILKKVLNSSICKWAYARLHPNFGLYLMKKFSYKSRDAGGDDSEFHGKEKERLVCYAERKLSNEYYDYFIFGHRHLPLKITLSNQDSFYYGLGDWTEYQSFGVLENGEFSLQYFNMPDRTRIVL